MEAIFGIIAVLGGLWIIGAIIGAVGAWLSSLFNGGESQTPAGGASEPQIQKLAVRLRAGRFNTDDPDSPMVKWIEGKGWFPHTRETNISFITSLLDKSAGEMPVLCPVNRFQEPQTIAYQFTREFGELEPCGLREWLPLGLIIPELIPPHGGKRRLTAVLRMVDADNPPDIFCGRGDSDHPGLIWQETLEFDWIHDGKGYEETAKHRDEARALSLKIAMAVAMADGNLDNAEGGLIKRWIMREIAPYEDEKRERLKNLYNNALRESHANAKRGALNIDPLARRLNEIGEKPIKYEAIELCFDVMSADGVAHDAETKTIRRVARLLELDMHEIERMRDKTIVGLGATNVSVSGGHENLLGIEPGWSEKRIGKHLLAEFAKWNNRLETLSAGKKRDNAQHMLNLIAKERQRNEKRQHNSR